MARTKKITQAEYAHRGVLSLFESLKKAMATQPPQKPTKKPFEWPDDFAVYIEESEK